MVLGECGRVIRRAVGPGESSASGCGVAVEANAGEVRHSSPGKPVCGWWAYVSPLSVRDDMVHEGPLGLLLSFVSVAQVAPSM